MDAIANDSRLFPKIEIAPPSRVVVYVVENGTSGPVARAAKIARQLSDAGADVTMLLPRARLHSPMIAPDIKKVAYEAKQMWRPSAANPQWQIAKLRPDALLVDEYPFVSQDHAHAWEPVISAAKRMNRNCVVHGMSCDIPIYYKDAEARHLPKRAKRLDHIWVTGDPEITNFSEYVHADAMPHIAPKLNYVGFMNEMPADRGLAPATDDKKKKEILVYLGGGHVGRFASRYVSLLANMPLLSDALKQAQWRFVLPEDYDSRDGAKIYNMLRNLPEELQAHVAIEQTDLHFKDKLQQADMVITGGGQTAIESVLVESKPTLILPSFFGEQFARAKDFSARFPEQVTAADIPVHSVPAMTTKRLRYNMHHRIEEKNWVDQTLEWVEGDPHCKKLREAMEKTFTASDRDHPRPQIMLDGAQRIANEAITRQAPARSR